MGGGGGQRECAHECNALGGQKRVKSPLDLEFTVSCELPDVNTAN